MGHFTLECTSFRQSQWVSVLRKKRRNNKWYFLGNHCHPQMELLRRKTECLTQPWGQIPEVLEAHSCSEYVPAFSSYTRMACYRQTKYGPDKQFSGLDSSWLEVQQHQSPLFPVWLQALAPCTPFTVRGKAGCRSSSLAISQWSLCHEHVKSILVSFRNANPRFHC